MLLKFLRERRTGAFKENMEVKNKINEVLIIFKQRNPHVTGCLRRGCITNKNFKLKENACLQIRA